MGVTQGEELKKDFCPFGRPSSVHLWSVVGSSSSMAQPVLSVGDTVCIDGLNDARFGTITAISRHDPPSYAVELHKGTIEYNVACER